MGIGCLLGEIWLKSNPSSSFVIDPASLLGFMLIALSLVRCGCYIFFY